MSDRIDHLAAAREWLAAAERPDISLDETTAFADIAQAHATLALVEQQRIANLLEAGEARVVKLDPWDLGSDIPDLKPEIREALGLRE